MADTITISKKEYDKLVKDSEFLETLKCFGVDNWNGYSEAVEAVESLTK